MNKHVSMKKKVLSFFLAFVILFSSMPAELFTFAKAEGASASGPAVSVKLTTDPSSSADGESVKISPEDNTDAKLKINVTLAENVESAEVAITLSEDAATLIDMEELQKAYSAEKFSLSESDHKLSFTATEKSKEYSIPLQYPDAEPTENEELQDIALKIDKNDVSVTVEEKEPEQTPETDNEGTEEQQPGTEPDGSDNGETGQENPGTPSEETTPGTDTGNQPPSEGGGIEQLPPTSNDGNSDSNTPTTTPGTDDTTTDTGNQPSMEQNPVDDVVDTVVESMSVQAANAAEDNVEIDANVNLLFKAPAQQTDDENKPEDEGSQDGELVDLTISGPSGDVQIGDDNTFDLSFSASATLKENVKIPEGTDKLTFAFNIKLPTGITAEGAEATLGEESSDAEIKHTYNEGNNTLTLTITQPLKASDDDVTPANRSGEKTSWSYDITVTGLQVSDDFAGGNITINADGKEVTIPVNNTNEPEPADKFYSLSIKNVGPLQPTERQLPDFTVTTTAKQIAATEEVNFQFTLSFALPEGLSLPEGDYSVDNGEIKAGSTTIATCSTLPEGTTANYNSETNVLSLSIAQAGLTSTADTALANWTYALAFKGDAFTLAGDFGEAEIVVSATPGNPDQCVSADGVSATITINAETVEGEKGTQAAEHKNITQKVSWMDNHDTASRPDPEDFPATELYFQVGSGKWQKLDFTTIGSVHLNTLPKVTVTQGEGDNYTIGCDQKLPTKLITLGADGQPIPGNELEIHWSFGLPDADGNVTPTEVPGYEASVNEEGDWVYVKLIDFIFTTQLRWGTMGSNDAVTDAFLNDFALFTGIEGDDGQKLAEKELYEKIDPSDDPNPDGTYTVTIHDLPMFNVENNHLIDYYIEYVGSSTNGMVLDVELDAGDEITASFNNAGSSNHGNVTNKLYAGGVLTLLLTGKTNFHAFKEWLDQGVDDYSKRPDVSFSLLRYVEGEDITTAAPVPKTDSGYGFVTIELDEDGKKAEPQDPVELVLNDLEKYDPEGRRYVYLLREEMTATDNSVNYEKVFGEVERQPNEATETVRDTLPENYGNDGNRRSGDNNLYNGGTISNRIHDNETATLEKVWNAAAYQGQLQDVKVTFELKVDYMNNAGKDWENIWHPVYDDNRKPITKIQDKITEENLAGWTQTVTVPTYGPLGRDARYKWVEVSVSQGESNENLYNEETGTFTLTHDGKQVTYTSKAEWDEETSTTTITNSVADTVDYEVTKKWEGMESSKVTFDLYQLPSGSSVTEDSQPYISFDWDGEDLTINNSGQLSQEKMNELGISFDKPTVTGTNPNSQWDTVFKDLPRFDQNGREYEYVLLERVGAQGIVPNYETMVEENEDGKKTYHTTVINEPGPGTRILVRKEWSDDSDSAHRGAVTIQVYDKDGNTLLNEPVILQDGVWMQEVGINLPAGQDVDDIYILETTVSLNGQNTSVPLQPYTFGDKDPANTTVPESPLTGDNVGKSYQYETQYHRYEATYSKTKVSGQDLFVVNNRRLGNIDMTVEKIWKDGDGQLRNALAEANDKLETDGYGTVTPYLELVFEDGYTNVGTISEEDGQCYVELKGSTKTPIYSDDDGTMPVGKYQELLLFGDESTQTVNFYNLPKYERDGTVVRYNVREVWKCGDTYGSIEDAKAYLATKLDGYETSELKALLDKFSSRVVQTGYTANDENNDENKGGIQDDQKTVSVTNSLNGSKEIVWHKHWNDQYTYTQNQRPDLYLDIYRVVHNSADADDITVEEVVMDYLWKPDKISKTEEGETVVTEENDPNNWTVTLSNVPKYDDYGFEIVYYAVERTVVKFDTFDYQLGEYVYDDTSLGNRDAINAEYVTDGTTDKWALSFDDVNKNGDFETGIDASEITADSYPNYALRENGTFVNSLGDTVTIQGQKIWEYMPSGYPAVDFPAVTFEVYQTLDGDVPDTAEPVATYTMTKWADAAQSGTYQFEISHTGENNPDVAAENPDDGAETAETTEDLPRYDEQGQMYVYVLREENATLNGEKNVSLDDVFDYVAPETNTYLAKNRYNPPKGEINVQKHLELQTVAEDELEKMAFPTIAFKITRSYTGTTNTATGEQGTVQDNNWSETIYWSSADVKAAYNDAKDSASGDKVTVTSEDLKFENLPIYAPNGSEYVYTVTETMTIGEGDDAKDFLYGYTASAAKGQLDVAEDGYTAFDADQTPTVADLKPQEAGEDGQPTEEAQSDDSWATFKDTFTQKQIKLKGTKVWDDFNNAFNVRPDKDGLTLTVSRYANSQPGLPGGASDAIAEQNITRKVKIVWDEDSLGTNNWTYTIEGKDGFQLDAYAPNGTPWIYKVTEKLGDQSLATIYIATPHGGKVTVSADNDTKDNAQLKFPDLKNSMNTDISFQKIWHDQNDQPITQDFLGKDLTVTFELQVREKNSGEWKKADEFFKGILKEEFATIFPKGLDADQEITARINAGEKTWSGKFANLPAVYKLGSESTFRHFEYRVVEKSVEYNGLKQEIVVDNDNNYYPDDANYGLVDEATLATSDDKTLFTTTNKLKLGSLSIEKVWVDGGNQYGTRPSEGVAGYTWVASFAVQKKTDNDTWEMVKDAAGNDLVVTLRGDNTDAEASRKATVAGLPTGETYRVVELQPGWNDDGKITDDDIVLDGLYNETYKTTYKDLDPAVGSDEPVMSVTVTNTLTTIEEKDITVVKDWYPELQADDTTREITAVLQYSNDSGATWTPLKTVKLNATNGWTHTWEDLPLYYNASQTPTEYRVIEEGTQEDYPFNDVIESTAADGTIVFTLVNIGKTELEVEKKWYGVDDEKKTDIDVALYRTTDENAVGNTAGLEPVETANLTAADDWKHTFSDLQAYDKNGNKYLYFAKENTTGDFATEYDYTPGKTTITNIGKVDINGTKTWVDNNNAYGTRPTIESLTDNDPSNDGLTLVLFSRTTNPDAENAEWTEVTDATPVWTQSETDQNVWNYSYSDLPATDDKGQAYTYKVEEILPTDSEYEGQQEDYNFTNTLKQSISVSGTKTWHDAQGADRPANLTLTLYQKLDQEGSEWTEMTDAEPVWSGKESDVWSYSYNDLQKYNDQGVLYLYKVEETVPDGYDGKTTEGTALEENHGAVYKYDFDNYKRGALEVTKSVSGNRGDKTKEFNFTVTLSGTSSNGEFKGEELNGTYGDMMFKNGVATFTLKDGETKTALDLPAGLQYAVVEEEADKDGYTTTSSGDSGTINAGYKATAAFNNHRHHSSGGGNDKTSVSVEKEWVTNNGGTPAASVQVQLYRDGKAYGDPVTLNAGNGWSHDWTQLDANHVWTVKEVGVTDGFNVYIDRNGNTIVLVNNDIGGPDPEEPPDEPTDIPDPEKPEEENPPTDPDDPTDKPTDTPDDPTDTPDDPTDEPDKPTTDVPDTEKPNTPSNPSNPSNPSTPTYPTTSNPTTTTTTKTDKDAPKTGDNTHTRALFALCLASLAGMTVIGVSRKRQRKDDSDQS